VVAVTPEGTPNPNAVKFTLDRPATDKRSETFRAGSDPADLTANFVSVTKQPDTFWDDLVPDVIEQIEAFFG
jgi:hypothetical protein